MPDRPTIPRRWRLSSLWVVIICVVSLAFIAWSASLLLSVNRQREAVAANVRLISKLTLLEQSLTDMEPLSSSPEITATAWNAANARVFARLTELEALLPAFSDLAAGLGGLRAVLRPDPGLPAVAVENPFATASRETYWAAVRTNVHLLREAIRRSRARLSGISTDLSAKWDELTGIVFISCALALLSSGLLFGYRRELVKRRSTELSLHTHANRLRLTLERIPLVLWTIDRDLRFTSSLGAGLSALGLQPGEVVGMTLFEYFQTADPDFAPIAAHRRALGGESVNFTAEWNERFYQNHIEPLRNRTGEIMGATGVAHDVTDLHKLEADCVRVQKLESLGTLAGGIAHDFNNVLTGIVGNISLARRESDLTPKSREHLQRAEQAAERARGLTQQLLTFSRGGEPIKEILDLAELIRDTAAFALGGKNVHCECSFPEDFRLVEADPGQLRQVVTNLGLNAAQSMSGGGTLRIRGANVELSPHEGPPVRPGAYVRVDFVDEGVGISKENLPRIFDPYFTTKENGSGLGLTTADSIVRKHGGHLRVDASGKSGTTFSVYLPASGVSGPRATSDIRTPRKQARILVVDDEQLVRDTLSQILRHLGFDTEVAESGQAAIETCARATEAGRPYDVAILDLTVRGGMGGAEAIHEMRRVTPHMRAIVSSGYSNDPVMSDPQSFGFDAVLPKPYAPEDVVRTLGELIPADVASSAKHQD